MSLARSARALGSLAILLALSSSGIAQTFSVDSVTPEEASYVGGTPAVIEGNGFAGVALSDITVELVDATGLAIPATVLSATNSEITVRMPIAAIGTYSLSVQVGVNPLQLLGDAIDVIGPLAVDSFNPLALPSPTSGQVIDIVGVGFTPTATVRLEGNPVPTFYTDPRTLRAELPDLNPGSYTVSVAQPFPLSIGIVASAPDPLVVTSGLTITQATPNIVSYLPGTPIEFIGSFSGDSTFEIGGQSVIPTTITDDVATILMPEIDSDFAGNTIPVTIVDPLGTFVVPGVLEIAGPLEIVSVDPDSFEIGIPATTFIFGNGFTPNARVQIMGQDAVTTFLSFQQLSAEVPTNLPEGVHDVAVTDGSADAPVTVTQPDALTLYVNDPPVITRIEPRRICREQATELQIYGSGFLPDTLVTIGGVDIIDTIVEAGGQRLTCIHPPDPGAPVGAIDVTVSDFRGSTNFSDIEFTPLCPTLLAPCQFQTSLARGTARFSWFNPETYDSIEVRDAQTGALVATLPPTAAFFETPTSEDSVDLLFQGVTAVASSNLVGALAARMPCIYPPAIGGAVLPGDIDLPIRGGHAEASDVVRCDVSPPSVFEIAPIALFSEPQEAGTVGYSLPADVYSQIVQFLPLQPGQISYANEWITGFTLSQPTDRLEIQAYYSKVATDFGLSLRGKIVQVFPDTGFADEFTFPEVFLDQPKAPRAITYFRADRDVSDPTAQPCLDMNDNLLQLEAGEYRLEIYAVGGTTDVPYYILANDPRDQEIFIEGVPCPPYPLVRVRDVQGFPTLPNISNIITSNVVGSGFSGEISVDFTALGTYFNANGDLRSIDTVCEEDPLEGDCDDPMYEPNPEFEYCWRIFQDEVGQCETENGPTLTKLLPDFGCYKIELTIFDKSCGIERTFTREVAILPEGGNYCSDPEFTFSSVTPDPDSIYLVTGLKPAPGMGRFSGNRPLDIRVLVTPDCFCPLVGPLSGCPAALLQSSGSPTNSMDDVEFRLSRTNDDNPASTLPVSIIVDDLCIDVQGGPKYFSLFVEDLSVIADQLPSDFDFGKVYVQGKTNRYGLTPIADDDWATFASFNITNSPTLLDDAFWKCFFEPETGTYRFTCTGTENSEEPLVLGDSPDVPFGIVDTGIPASMGNQIDTGFTSRFSMSNGMWSGDTGSSSGSGDVLDNTVASCPMDVAPEEIPVSNSAIPGVPKMYRWCDELTIVEKSFSQELFRAIIYAGFIGPIPVNIFGSVGLGLNFDLKALSEIVVSPFEAISGNDFATFNFQLEADVQVSIPCKIGVDILGGIASIGLGLRPSVSILTVPYILGSVGSSSPTITPGLYQTTSLDIFLDVEACIQTIIAGEQCLPTITIPLAEDIDILPPQGTPPPTVSCSTSVQQIVSLPQPGGNQEEITIYEYTNNPVSIVSPDGVTTVDIHASANAVDKLVNIFISENGVQTFAGSEQGLVQPNWYFISPTAEFTTNSEVVIGGCTPASGYIPAPVADRNDPNYFVNLNENHAATEIQAVRMEKVMGGWLINVVSNLFSISDDASTPLLDRRADGAPHFSSDLSTGEAVAAWVRYTGDYLVDDGPRLFFLPNDGFNPACPPNERFCKTLVQNIRPNMESTSIAVRRFLPTGLIPGEGIVTISDPGINVQPHIDIAPSGNVGYCVWIHDPLNTNLTDSNVGRFLKYSVYDKVTNTWSAPLDVVPNPDDFPGMLDPEVRMVDDQNGLIAFTALPEDADEDDSGLGGGSRLLYVCRIQNGAIGAPQLIRGACEELVYAWGHKIVISIDETAEDPVDALGINLCPLIITFQEFGEVGGPHGTGNLMTSVLDEVTGQWTPAETTLGEGRVFNTTTATVVGGQIHSQVFDAGPSEIAIGAASPALPLGYRVDDTPLCHDAAIIDCKISDPFGSPGSFVTATVQVKNEGQASTPFNLGAQDSALGIEIIYRELDGTEELIETQMLPIMNVMEVQTRQFTIEIPHDGVELIARLTTDAFDSDPTNNEEICFLGSPPPQNLFCEGIVEFDPASGADDYTVMLEWVNPVFYDEIILYRDGAMVRSFPGKTNRYVDTDVDLGLYTYELRGRVGASKSQRVGIECEVLPPIVGPRFLRGDINQDDVYSIADAINALQYLFSGGDTPCDAAVDFNADGATGIGDVIGLLSFLFAGGTPPAAPYPDCDTSTFDTDDVIGCDNDGC